MRWLNLLFLCALILAAAGCSDNYPVSGKVVFTDGTPVPLVSIIFELEDGVSSAVGRTDRQGHFEMLFEEPGDGVPPGNYGVIVRPPNGLDLKPGEEKLSPGPGWGIPGKYRNPTSSGLSIAVDRQMSDVVFEIEKRVSGKARR